MCLLQVWFVVCLSNFLFFLLLLFHDKTAQKITCVGSSASLLLTHATLGILLIPICLALHFFCIFLELLFQATCKTSLVGCRHSHSALQMWGKKVVFRVVFRKLNQCVKEKISLSKMILREHEGEMCAEYLFVHCGFALLHRASTECY